MTPAVNFPLFHGTRGLGGGSWQGFDFCQRVRSLVAPSSRFSVTRGRPLAPSPLITAPPSVGPAFGVCQWQRVSPKHVRHPLLQLAAPPGRGREPGAETAPPAKMPEPQPPQRRRASPRSPRRQRAGAGIGWEQDAGAAAEPAVAGAGPRVSSGAVDEDDANNHPHLAATCLHVGQSTR